MHVHNNCVMKLYGEADLKAFVCVWGGGGVLRTFFVRIQINIDFYL
jgi:hypothetical protein